jgi:uncharacterized protein with PCYCGC motif
MSSRRAWYACIVAVALVGAVAGCDSRSSDPAPSAQQVAAPVPTTSAPPPASASDQGTAASTTASADPWLTRAPQLSDADIPPLPEVPFPAARPMEVVRSVYVFAARHPEVLSHVPCFCGCESRGHKHNDDCFVSERDAQGRPTKWEPHGIG